MPSPDLHSTTILATPCRSSRHLTDERPVVSPDDGASSHPFIGIVSVAAVCIFSDA